MAGTFTGGLQHLKKRAKARPQRETGFGNVIHRICSERHASQAQ